MYTFFPMMVANLHLGSFNDANRREMKQESRKTWYNHGLVYNVVENLEEYGLEPVKVPCLEYAVDRTKDRYTARGAGAAVIGEHRPEVRPHSNELHSTQASTETHELLQRTRMFAVQAQEEWGTTVQDLALNVDNVCQTDDDDAYDSDDDRLPRTHYVMANLSSCKIQCMDEAVRLMIWTSYHEYRPMITFRMLFVEHHEEHGKRNDVTPSYVVLLATNNPLCLHRARQVQPALYSGHVIVTPNHAPAVVRDGEETLELTEISRKKMHDKMKANECVDNKVNITPPNYSKENFLATFTPQKQLTPEQIFWSQDIVKMKAEALKEQNTRPIKALTVQLFSKFEKTCKKRITPTGITEGERGFEQTKTCYLTEVIPFFKTLQEHFEGIQKALTKEVKEMSDAFDELEAELDQSIVDRKHDEIERKNLLIEHDNIIEMFVERSFYVHSKL
ncbi:hypothetical protein Tco_1057608 [Tanacetum coccineum]|uniref:Uncharacterized protein n=1 Tax=Tanacetum coccineum TaxID=301880 RepID=A0ABQ5H642_9ASTR